MKRFILILIAALLFISTLAQNYIYEDVINFASLNEGFSTLATILQTAEIDESLIAPQAAEGFTFLAPTDEAFAGLADQERTQLLSTEDQAKTLLDYLVIPARVSLQDIVERANGEPVRVVTLAGSTLGFQLSADGRIIVNETATLTVGDIEAGRGLVHVIDALVSPSGVNQPGGIPLPPVGKP